MVATENQNTRNNGYIIINGSKNYISKVSYGVNLIDHINELNVLKNAMTENDFNNIDNFRKILSELDKVGYSVFQLTRL